MHLEWGDRELINQILIWKFPLVWEKICGRVWGKFQGMA